MPARVAAWRAARRTPPRRWLAAIVIAGVSVGSVWIALAVTPPATVGIGSVQARISAAPGSGTVVRSVLGRPVTDDTVNHGPLRVQVAIAVNRQRPTSEPQLLASIRAARPRVIRAGVLYLVRVAMTAMLLALVLVALLLGRAWRRLVLTVVAVTGVVTGGVAATAATTHASVFAAASCAHGWSRYAIADLPYLTPPAPTVSAPADVTAAANPDLIPVVLISDDHLNPEGLDFARALQRATGARAVLDAGDTTSFGVPGEACVVAPKIRSFDVPYVWVRGNHDSVGFERTMRSISSVRVLDGGSTTVAGITVFGLGDPSFTPRHHTPPAVMLANADRARSGIVSAIGATATVPDLVLVHECNTAIADDPANPGVAGVVPLVACGHTHRYAIGQVGATTVLHTGSVGAGGLGAPGNTTLGAFDAQLLFFSATAPHRLVRYFDVHGGGGRQAEFTEHDLARAPESLVDVVAAKRAQAGVPRVAR